MVLVSGSTGLLGAHILVELIRSNYSIRALKRSTSDLNQVLSVFTHYFPLTAVEEFSKIDWVEGDITDVVSLDMAMEGCETVFHAAAMVSFERREFKKMMRVNKKGTANIVNVALIKNVKNLVYISSVAALGRDGREGVYSETSKWKSSPENSGYAISKYAAEMEMWRGIEEGLNAVIVNPTIILGPGNWNASSVTFFKAMHKGLKLYPTGTNGFVDARDVAKIARLLLEKEVFNDRFITVGENSTFKELFTKISISFGKKAPIYSIRKWMLGIAWRVDAFLSFFGKKRTITKETARSSRTLSKYDNSKVRDALGYNFYTLDETIENASTYFSNVHSL